MNAYEKLVEEIRKQGRYYNPPHIQIGIVADSEGTIKLGGLNLKKKDYLINCNLRLENGEKIYLHKRWVSSGNYVTDSSHNSSMQEYKKNLLAAGDKLALVKVSGMEKYIVLAKVVDPE